MDHLTAISVVKSIDSKTHPQIIQILSSMQETDLKNILFAAVSVLQPSTNAIFAKEASYSTNLIAKCFKQYFAFTFNSVNVHQSTLLSLPSSIGAYILSFCNMKERICIQYTSRDCFKWCQIPIAHSDLVVDRAFVENITTNPFTVTAFKNIKHLDLKFMFCASNKRKYEINTESKYYSRLTQILSKSTLNSVHYNLTHCYPQNTLNINTLKSNLSYNYGQNATLFTFISKLMDQSVSFRNVECLTLSPYISGGSEFVQKHEVQALVKCFPNLKTFIIPKIYGYMQRISASSIWNFIHNYFNTLTHLEINMDNITRWLQNTQHPLSYFHKFKMLQTLNLTLNVAAIKILGNYLSSTQDFEMKCYHLHNISLQFTATFAEDVQPQIMDDIWRYVLSYCPNVVHYRFVVESQTFIDFPLKYDHLMGHCEKLQSMQVNDLHFFTLKIAMLSLKDIKIHNYGSNVFSRINNNNLNWFNNFKYTPCLESFIWIDCCRSDITQHNNAIVTSFLTYCMEGVPNKPHMICNCHTAKCTTFQIRNRVKLRDGKTGIIRYIGSPHFAHYNEEWIGIELDSWCVNAGDGTLCGQKLFTASPNTAYFTHPSFVTHKSAQIALAIGSYAKIKGLARVTKYNGDVVKMVSYNRMRARWRCLSNNESKYLGIYEKNLVPILKWKQVHESMRIKPLTKYPVIGERVKVITGAYAVVKYIGSVAFVDDEKTYIGLQLEQWNPNGHNGTVKNKMYFNTEYGFGYFVLLEHLVQSLNRNYPPKRYNEDYPPKSLNKIGLIHKYPQIFKTAVNRNDSVDLCRLIVSVSNTTNIKYIELSPLVLKQKELKYLSFWFHGKFGQMTWKKHKANKGTKAISTYINLAKYDL